MTANGTYTLMEAAMEGVFLIHHCSSILFLDCLLYIQFLCMKMKPFLSLAAALLVGAASAGTVVWDGRFNEFTSSTDLKKCSYISLIII